MREKKQIGWSIFLVECADGAFHGGMARSIEDEIREINVYKKGRYFKCNDNKLPVKLIYEERGLGFREAFAKKCYLIEMNRRQRLTLLKKKQFNNSWLLYMRGFRSDKGLRGFSR